jgi:hypothetical protein
MDIHLLSIKTQDIGQDLQKKLVHSHNNTLESFLIFDKPLGLICNSNSHLKHKIISI